MSGAKRRRWQVHLQCCVRLRRPASTRATCLRSLRVETERKQVQRSADACKHTADADAWATSDLEHTCSGRFFTADSSGRHAGFPISFTPPQPRQAPPGASPERPCCSPTPSSSAYSAPARRRRGAHPDPGPRTGSPPTRRGPLRAAGPAPHHPARPRGAAAGARRCACAAAERAAAADVSAQVETYSSTRDV